MTGPTEIHDQCNQANRRPTPKDYSDFLIRKLMSEYRDRHWVAVTLTLWQRRRRPDGTWQKLTRREVQECVRSLMKTLNKRVYKAAFRRYGKRLAVIPSIEEGLNHNLHVHMVLVVPIHWENRVDGYCRTLKAEWGHLSWAARMHKVIVLPTPRDVAHWTHYMMKEIYERDFSLDLENLHL